MLTVGWFSTGRGEGSLGLLRFIQDRIHRGEIDANIQFVFSNRDAGEAEGSDRFFQQVNSYGLPLVTHSSQKFRRSLDGSFAEHRLEYDEGVMTRLDRFNPDVCVLAGYMLIVGGRMCRRFTMANLHPALPTGPIGTWQEVIWSLIGSGANKTGAMVHLVTEDVDRGPVMSYFTLPIVGSPFEAGWQEVQGQPLAVLKATQGEHLALFKLIRQEGYRREPWLLSCTLDALAKGSMSVVESRTVDQKGAPIEGLCLDTEIEDALARS